MMMKSLKGFLVGALLIFLLAVLQAVTSGAPASSGAVAVKQPGANGPTFEVTGHGNEWFHWHSTKSGDVVIEDERGFWQYATLDGEELVPSGHHYLLDAAPSNRLTSASLQRWLKRGSNSKVLNAPALVKSSGEASVFGEQLGTVSSVSGTGTQSVLVLLVSTTNQSIQSSITHWQNIFFNDGTTTQSLKSFYEEQSEGALEFVPAEENYATEGTVNDGIVKVTVAMTHPNNNDNLRRKLVKQALIAADSYVDFQSFDTNDNGSLSNDELHVVTIVAGYESAITGAPTPGLWGHQWSFNNHMFQGVDALAPTLDEVMIGAYSLGGGYAQFGEYHAVKTYMAGKRPATLGIIAHEMGHMFDLPDLYDTDDSSDGIGMHSLMSGGTWGYLYGGAIGTAPIGFDAYSKVRLGWFTPLLHSSGLSTYTLKSIGTGEYNVLKVTTANPQQYFLLENRQFQGIDLALGKINGNGGIHQGGISIWHIDESKSHNDTDTRRLVDLEEAKNSASNPYFYEGHVTVFDNATKPNSQLNGAVNSARSIFIKSMSGDEMGVQVASFSGDTTAPSAPTNVQSSNISWTSFELSWTASTDNFAVLEYQILLNGKVVGKSSTTSHTVTGLKVNTTYSVTVRAVDYAQKISAASTAIPVTTPADTTAPAKPSGLQVENKLYTSARIVWSAATDNVAVTKYEIYRGGTTLMGTVVAPVTAYQAVNLAPGTEYTVTVVAVDGSGNKSVVSDGLVFETVLDETKPTIPENVRITKVTNTGATVTWAASVDNVKVSGYNLYLGGSKLNSSLITKTTYNVTGQSAGSTMTISVEAVDSSGNLSTDNHELKVTLNTSAAAGPVLTVTKFVNLFAKQGVAPAITYTLAATATVNLKIYKDNEMVGSAIINNESKAKGTHTSSLDAGLSLADGRYSLELTAGNVTNTSKYVQTFTIDRGVVPTVSTTGLSAPEVISALTDVSKIQFTLSERSFVTVKIVQGSLLVNTLVTKADLPAGKHIITWDGRNTKKQAVATGSYTAQISLTDTAGNAATSNTNIEVSVSR